MKTSIQLFALLFAILFYVQANAQDNTQTRKNKIIKKALKHGLLLDDDVLGAVDFADNNRLYYLIFNRKTAGVYYRDGDQEANVVFGDIFKLYSHFLDGDIKKENGGRISVSNQKLFIGAPTSDEFKTPQKPGAGQHFEGGSIYWSQPTGAHELHGSIRDKWKALGWENSFLGFPTSDETSTPDGFGKFNSFQGGMIYYHPHLGTFVVSNMTVNIWKKEGWEKGKLGYPKSDEIIKNNNSTQLFEFGAVISTKAGAYKIIYNGDRRFRGLYNKWLETGGVDSYLGDLVTPNKYYPQNNFAYFAEFQNGYIYETQGTYSANDAFVIKKGPIFDYYASKKWEQGYLGYPISDEYISGDGIAQDFKGGVVYYTKARGAFEIKK